MPLGSGFACEHQDVSGYGTCAKRWRPDVPTSWARRKDDDHGTEAHHRGDNGSSGAGDHPRDGHQGPNPAVLRIDRAGEDGSRE